MAPRRGSIEADPKRDAAATNAAPPVPVARDRGDNGEDDDDEDDDEGMLELIPGY